MHEFRLDSPHTPPKVPTDDYTPPCPCAGVRARQIGCPHHVYFCLTC
jgi:hypothetical protein